MQSSTKFLVLLLTTGLMQGCTAQDSTLQSVNRETLQDSTIPNGFDVEGLWSRATPISEEVLEIWTEAIDNLGSTENRSCTYTKVTEPCEDCGDELTRRSFYAVRHSLLQPGLEALMEWFDTPATHTVSAKVEEKFDPTQEPPWTLLTLDNAEPTEQQRYSHFQEKIALHSSVEQKRARRSERTPVGDFHPAAMKTWFESLKPTHYLGTNNGTLYVGLQPNRKSKSPITKHLQLTIAIDTETRDIAMFDQRALRSFVPHFGLRINDLNYQGTFTRDPNLNIVVLSHFEYSFRVRLTAIFPSKNHFIYDYRDFDCESEAETSEPRVHHEVHVWH